MFDQIETYLLQRIFEDLDPNIFNNINLNTNDEPYQKIPKTNAQIKSSIRESKTTTIHFKYQIKVFNHIIKLLEPITNKLNKSNYKIAVLYLENSILNPQKTNNTRRHILDIIYYIYENIDDEQILDLKEIEKILHLFIRKNDEFDSIISDLNYFIIVSKHDLLKIDNIYNPVKTSKLLILNALSLTYSFELFHYPETADKLDKLNIHYKILINQFAPYYFTYALNENLNKKKFDETLKYDLEEEHQNHQNHQQHQDIKTKLSSFFKQSYSLPKFEEVAIKFCELNTESNVDLKIMELFDAISLAELETEEIVPKFEQAFIEYLKWRKIFDYAKREENDDEDEDQINETISGILNR
ncbi:hypothetical protein KGF54_000140 [Candida jiufengensis]|uniref:uncharacterized protein n=1 Tax=Candida jiufengensis TaxID=497108 RepID=UPI0022258857|nr:uncharacterized protein KGF54_000140 [Candida jiufengensis]KAI5957212.1 hypothetical protein KGF54_000140 [Candida jiufengensis]